MYFFHKMFKSYHIYMLFSLAIGNSLYWSAIDAKSEISSKIGILWDKYVYFGNIIFQTFF